tara:strand:+ start:812 stop:1483 length:672 start_codon:yes stop_codon:yes gene_type:complete
MTTPAVGAGPSCTAGLGALLSVVISGTVRESLLPSVAVGDTLSISFLAEPKALVREVPGQGIVTDGIAPYKVCPEEFEVSTSSGFSAHYTVPPVVPPLPGVEPDPNAGALWFSMLSARSVHDGVYLSTDLANAAMGVPLGVHTSDPKTIFGGAFDVTFARHSLPNGSGHGVPITGAIGEFDAGVSVAASLKVWKDWAAHVVINADFDKMTISKTTPIAIREDL